MSTTETLATRGETRHAERYAYDGWLLRAFPEPDQPRIVLRAVLLSAAILGAEYLIEVVWFDLYYWRIWGSYLAARRVIMSALGLVFTLTLLGQWGSRYVELWADVRPAFDVSDERYDAAVRGSLRGLYGRDHVPFLLFAGVQVGVYWVFPAGLGAGYLHVGFLHFFATTILYCLYRHVLTIRRVTELDLLDVASARPTLTRIADFGVTIGIVWSTAVSLIVVYGLLIPVRSPVMAPEDRSALYEAVAELIASLGPAVVLAVSALAVVSLLMFLVPLVLLHSALAAAKHERIQRIESEYDALFDAWQDDGLERDPSVGLDLLEKRRRNVRAHSTWPYRIVSVGELLLASVIPVALSVVQTLGLVG